MKLKFNANIVYYDSHLSDKEKLVKFEEVADSMRGLDLNARVVTDNNLPKIILEETK